MFRNVRNWVAAALLIAAIVPLTACSVSQVSTPDASITAAPEASVATATDDSISAAPEEAPLAADGMRIPVSELDENPRFYEADVDGLTVKVIALKLPDGAIRTAYDACQVCYDSGRGYYEQAGDVLVCQNCGNRFQIEQVGVVAGGCNPVPIGEDKRTEVGSSIVIPTEVLKEGAPLFSYRNS